MLSKFGVELKSAIIVVEDNGEDYVGHRSKKDGERQNPSLWEIFKFLLTTYSLADSLTLTVSNLTFNGNELDISPVKQSALSHFPLQHFPPATSNFSSFTLLASMVAVFSLSLTFSETWQGMIMVKI